MEEIRRYDSQIKNHSNQIQNILMPQSYAINLTFNETKDKLMKLQHALTVLADKKQKVDADVEAMQVKLRASNQMHLQKESQKKLMQQLMDVEAEIQRCKAKEQHIEEIRSKLQTAFAQKQDELVQSKLLVQKRQHYFDPLNSTGSSNQINNEENVGAQIKDREAHLEDEQIRRILDSIDIKIGQVIEDKEQDNLNMQLLHAQLAEAKDGFSSAYRSYKLLKQKQGQVKVSQREG